MTGRSAEAAALVGDDKLALEIPPDVTLPTSSKMPKVYMSSWVLGRVSSTQKMSPNALDMGMVSLQAVAETKGGAGGVCGLCRA